MVKIALVACAGSLWSCYGVNIKCFFRIIDLNVLDVIKGIYYQNFIGHVEPVIYTTVLL